MYQGPSVRTSSECTKAVGSFWKDEYSWVVCLFYKLFRLNAPPVSRALFLWVAFRKYWFIIPFFQWESQKCLPNDLIKN